MHDSLKAALDFLSRPLIRILNAIGDVIVIAVAIKSIQWLSGWNVVAWVLS
jgi:hypothetical protein